MLSPSVFIIVTAAFFGGGFAAPKPKPADHAVQPTCSTPQSGAAPSCDVGINPVPQETVIVTTSGASTWSETFLATSIASLATLMTLTTIITTNRFGETLVAVVFAGGIGWVGVIPSEEIEILLPREPPTADPTPEPTLSWNTPTSTGIPVTDASTATFTPFVSFWPKFDGLQAALAALIAIPDDVTQCSDSAGPFFEKGPLLTNAQQFCESQNGTTVTSSTTPSTIFNMGAGIILNVAASLNNICSAADKCSTVLQQTLDNCMRPNTGQTYGGKVQNGCEVWTTDIQESSGVLVCTGTAPGTGVLGNEAISNIQDFCTKIDGISSGENSSNLLSYTQFQGDSQAVLEVSYRSSDTCDHTGLYKISKDACIRFLTRTINDCNTDTATAKYGGSVTDDCGVFSYTTQAAEKVFCGGNHYIPPATFTSDEATSAINGYCGISLTLDPNAPTPTGFSPNQPPGESYDNYKINNKVIRMQALFISDQTGCLPLAAFNTQGSECVRKLQSIVNTCDPGTTDAKNGGYITDNTQHGCTGWEIYPQGT